MGSRLDAGFVSLQNGLDAIVEVVAAVDSVEGAVEGAFDTIFDQNVGVACFFGQVVEQVVRHAVGSRTDGQAGDLIERKRLFVQTDQPVRVAIGVAICLKVGNEFLVVGLVGKESQSGLYLRANTMLVKTIGGCETLIIAEYTATSSFRAVAVRARSASGYRNFLHPASENTLAIRPIIRHEIHTVGKVSLFCCLFVCKC